MKPEDYKALSISPSHKLPIFLLQYVVKEKLLFSTMRLYRDFLRSTLSAYTGSVSHFKSAHYFPFDLLTFNSPYLPVFLCLSI